ncbi:hypothetical protein SUGI_0105870 [Cryptomeria japonica]|uniref:non-specific lipid-transfer protein 2 n=1 Tax=Cryptomeria japonica TaxID=3369 RepID=UPI002408977B|nr:non-specific lipid-transfer protein 2 [Cryptomeria japonica]GLJ09301.1 hypothetical protein SUGI_0105870 [Cryptomeria japonica]
MAFMKNLIVLCAIVVLLLHSSDVARAVTCNPMALSPCASAMFGPSNPKPKPSSDCCNKLKLQQSCMCQYAKDKNLSKYINTPDAKRVASTCNVPFPKC